MQTMQVLHKETTIRIIRFDKGEEVLTKLAAYCKGEDIPSGHFTALGACQKITIAYYDLDEKKYIDKTYEEDLEIVGIIGNIAVMNEKYAIHAHGSFAGRDYNVFGGHVKILIASATCEVHLTVLGKKLTRGFDERTGLNLLK